MACFGLGCCKFAIKQHLWVQPGHCPNSTTVAVADHMLQPLHPLRDRSGCHTQDSQPLHWEDIVLIPWRISTWLALSAPWVVQRASEFYSLVMLNKRQRILGARVLNFLQSVRQLMAAAGPSGLLKYWKSPLDRWHHGEFTARVTCSAPYR